MQLSNALVALIFGAITSAVALGICLLLPFNILFFMVNYVLPAGAFAVGFVAAAGYYAGASILGYRPGYLFLVSMVLLSTAMWAGRFFVVYHYSHAAEVIPFADYMKEYLTHLKFKRSGHSDTNIGLFGYGVAALQWLGFVGPAIIYFFILRSKAYCENCGKFFKKMATLKKQFGTPGSMKDYLAKLASKPPFSFEYCDVLAENPMEEGSANIKLNFTLLQCPECKSELLKSDAMAKHGNKWVALKELGFMQKVPPGTSLMTAFGKQAA